MTVRTVKTVAAMANLTLLGLTVFVVTTGGVVLEGLHVVLVLLMILAPVLSIMALYWPSQPKSAAPASRGVTEGQE